MAIVTNKIASNGYFFFTAKPILERYFRTIILFNDNPTSIPSDRYYRLYCLVEKTLIFKRSNARPQICCVALTPLRQLIGLVIILCLAHRKISCNYIITWRGNNYRYLLHNTILYRCIEFKRRNTGYLELILLSSSYSIQRCLTRHNNDAKRYKVHTGVQFTHRLYHLRVPPRPAPPKLMSCK